MTPGRTIVAIAHLLVSLTLAACVTRLQSRDIERRLAPWCVSMTDRHGQYGVACVESAERCHRLVAAAKQYGALAGLVQIDECVYEEVER